MLRLGHTRRPEPEADRGGEQPPGLQAVELGEILVVARDVPVLAADHPERCLDELARRRGVVVHEREPDRLGEKRVALEDRDRLAERDVRARAAAANVVVVERGKVVVHERERVHELERGRCRQSLLDVPSGGLRDRETEHGADPLAARLERVADGLFEPTELGRVRKRREVLLDGLAQLVRRPHRQAPARASAPPRSPSRATPAR